MDPTRLPNRPISSIRRRITAIAVEVKVPSSGAWFGALAASVRPEGVFLSTFQEPEPGTEVVATLSLPDGPMELGGIVVLRNDPGAPGVAVAFADLDDAQRVRLSSASSAFEGLRIVA